MFRLWSYNLVDSDKLLFLHFMRIPVKVNTDSGNLGKSVYIKPRIGVHVGPGIAFHLEPEYALSAGFIPNPLIICSFMLIKMNATCVIYFTIGTISYCNQCIASHPFFLRLN